MDLVWVWTCCVITDISHDPSNKEKARRFPGFAVSSSRLTFCQALSTKTIILRYTKYREDNTDCRISHFALTLVDVTRPDRLSLTQYGQPHCWEKGLLVTLRIIGSHLRIKTKVLGPHILGKATVAVQYWMISALSIALALCTRVVTRVRDRRDGQVSKGKGSLYLVWGLPRCPLVLAARVRSSQSQGGYRQCRHHGSHGRETILRILRSFFTSICQRSVQNKKGAMSQEVRRKSFARSL